MTIQIPQPSMALNAERIATTSVRQLGDFYQVFRMWNTWTVGESVRVEHIIDHVAVVADRAPDHYLRVVVVNAHGTPAAIDLGNGWIRGLNPSFAKWRGKVANIWLTSCQLVNPSDKPQPTQAPDYNDGNLFCSGLAKLTGAYVVASQDNQPRVVLPLSWGHVPDWEGRVFRYEPDHGSVDWHHHYGTTPIDFAPPPPIAVPPRFRAFLGGPGTFWTEPREKPWYMWHPSQMRVRVPPQRRFP